MFGFNRLKYRDTVETSLSYLIAFNEPYFQKLYRSFDGIKGVIDDGFKAGREPMDFAVELWGIMFSHEIERSPQLTAEGERIIEFLINGGPHKFDTETAMGAFVNQADKQVILGKVKPQTFETALDEMIGALRGIERHERSVRRIARMVEEMAASNAEQA